jgi:cytochrome P450
MSLARQAFKGVTGKGIFHQLLGPPKYNGRVKIFNIFNSDTNEDWKIRRNSFRHPFSVSALQKFNGAVKGLVDRLCEKISVAARASQVIELDKLLGQLAMDAICRVAFSYDLHALDDSDEFQTVHTNLMGVLEVSE